jgi:hypothetical protein
MARRWVKLWVSESLRGTMRFDFTPAERGVWYDLLLLAGDCRQEGLISPGKDQHYPLRWIAGTLNISPSLLNRTLEKCKTCSRIEVNGNGITILNWAKYQSEYERQKPFRKAKVSGKSYKKVTRKVTTKVQQKLPVEGEVEEDTYKEDKKKEIYKERKESIKEKYGEFQNVLLSPEEYMKLNEKLSKQQVNDLIERLSGYMKQSPANANKYKDHYATILNWSRRDSHVDATHQRSIKSPGPRQPEDYTDPDELRRRSAA